MVRRQGREIVTVFYGSSVPEGEMEEIVATVEREAFGVEVFTVPTDSLSCLMTVSFE